MRLIGLTVVLAASLVVTPSVVAAQRVPVIGVLVVGTEDLNINYSRTSQPLREALRGFGWIDGENITLKPRFADLNFQRLESMAQDLVRQRVDVIVALGTPAAQAARRATTSVPIVMASSGDAVGAGLVTNLARPETNVTGMTLIFTEVAGKRLQLLKELVPRLSRAAVLSSGTQVARHSVDELLAAGPRLGVEVRPFVYSGVDQLPGQFAEMRAGQVDSLVVVAAHVLDEVRRPLAQLAQRHRLPTMFTFGEYVEAGGLVSYGPNLTAINRRAAYYVDRILRGAKPAELPVEQPTKFELVINLKTAKALGLTLPPSLLRRADQVIE